MTASPFPLESLRSLVVKGPDAFGFLQNQLSSDLQEVSRSSGQLSAWHDPKGRVLVFLRVLPWQDGFLLVMHEGLAAMVAQRLGMYILRAKVTLHAGPPVHGLAPEHAAEWLAAHDLAPSDEPLAAACAVTSAALRMPGRTGWLVAGELGADVGPRDPEAAVAWELAELQAGIPEVYPETSGKFVAQMLNLDLIGAISFSKGCYPGQEIVARAHHLGRVKRRARLFRARGAPPAPGDTLSDSGGAVVRAAASGQDCLVMAIVAESAEESFALADGRPLEA